MDSTSWPESLQSNRKKALQELTQGHQLINQLREMLRRAAVNEADPTSIDGVVEKILGMFDNTISMLNSPNSHEFSLIPTDVKRPVDTHDGLKSENSDESVKTATTTAKVRRRCYKRRKTSETNIIITPALIDDGHAWRKYGQKGILNAKHQRNYYRCTHKYGQGCLATKQVQMTEDEPPKYKITYNGHHTCRNLLKAPQIIFDSPSPKGSSILNFETQELMRNKQESFYFPSMKQEQHDDGFHLGGSSYNQLLSSDYYLSQNLVALGPFEPLMSSGSNHGDMISPGVYLSTGSTHGYEMDHALESIDFSDFLLEFSS